MILAAAALNVVLMHHNGTIPSDTIMGRYEDLDRCVVDLDNMAERLDRLTALTFLQRSADYLTLNYAVMGIPMKVECIEEMPEGI